MAFSSSSRRFEDLSRAASQVLHVRTTKTHLQICVRHRDATGTPQLPADAAEPHLVTWLHGSLFKKEDREGLIREWPGIKQSLSRIMVAALSDEPRRGRRRSRGSRASRGHPAGRRLGPHCRRCRTRHESVRCRARAGHTTFRGSPKQCASLSAHSRSLLPNLRGRPQAARPLHSAGRACLPGGLSSRARSAGVTPLIREAWAKSTG